MREILRGSEMTREEIEALKAVSANRVRVHCSEYHAHSADCLEPSEGGTQTDVTVCKLADELLAIKFRLYEFAEENAK